MFNIFDDQFLDDVVSRAEQSRFSYTIQTEEFRNLNSSLQNYLNDIKRIDDENRQLQENIEKIRTDYIIILENHLKRLPEDFREESQVLTEAHLERYKSKTRAKRFVNEREELKKRMNFLATNEKDQIKRLNNLQKQEHKVENELKILNEQLENLHHYVQTEKQAHQQAMHKVDYLQIQLEQICIERSKTEFEIQTLREEVKLMQTAKEFLDEEHQTMLSTQTEANEYFLSRLNESIARIREDFNELNQNQLKQIENEYKQIMKILEENTSANQIIDETMINHQRTMQIEYEKLQNEHQSTSQELTILNDLNQLLSEQVLVMEADLYSIRDERIRELFNKDNEFERNQIELQTLNEKLNHFAEYDRNLKFELTLYRGVLESEYRRKQQQHQLNKHQQPMRPTTLRTMTNKSRRNSGKNSINRNQLEPVIEKTDTPSDEIISTSKNPDIEKIQSKEEVNREEQQQTRTEITKSPISAVSEVQQSPKNQGVSVTNNASPPDLSSSLDDRQRSSETENVLISSADSTLPASSDIHQSPTASLEVQKLPESTTTNVEESLSSALPASAEDHSTPTDTQPLSSVPPTTDSELLSELQDSSTTPAVFEDQQISSASTPSQEDRSISPVSQRKVSTPSQEQSTSSEIQQVPTSDENIQERPSSGTIDRENQFVEVFEEYDNVANDEVINDQHQSTQFVERSPTEIESTLEQNQIITTTEEPMSSSDQNQTEKENKIDYISSAGYYGTINDSIHLANEELSRQSSHQTTLTDVEGGNTDLMEEVGSKTSLKVEEEDSDNKNQSNLESVIQDLRYVYRHLINDNDLVEINDDFPDNLIDRLEFGDNLIRTLFDNLLRKYIVQPMKTENRSNTLDWIEFRNILFPILTGRYTEGHLRNLFNLFDLDQTGYLSSQELAELLELLQVNNSNELAEKMTHENGKLNIDELIETIRKTDDVNKNLLAEDIESKQWYIQHPIDEENSDTQSLPLEALALHSPSRTNNGIILLSRIFKRVGADTENRQLDSKKPTLSMKLTNEFIHNNIHVSSDDLQIFIELYLNKKQTSDCLINWIEFRDVFLPLVNGGIVSNDDIARWFDIFDTNHNQIISSEQLLHLLRLLQVSNPENILNKIYEIFPDKTNSWTLADLMFALENIDETTTRFLLTNEQNTSFDLDWLRKNII